MGAVFHSDNLCRLEMGREFTILFSHSGYHDYHFYIIGYISFVKLSNERNGYFFLWKPLNRPVQIIVIIIGIMGFGYFGFTASESFAGYLIGMCTGAVIGFLISYFAIYKNETFVRERTYD